MHVVMMITMMMMMHSQRLAKNTLINALKKCAMSPLARPRVHRHNDDHRHHHLDQHKPLTTVEALVAAADADAEQLSVLSEAFALADAIGDEQSADALAAQATEHLGSALSRYWSLKVEMAAGSEPSTIAALFAELRPLTCGLSLCGAGAGGFGVAVLREGVSAEAFAEAARAAAMVMGAPVTVHSLQIDQHGIGCERL